MPGNLHGSVTLLADWSHRVGTRKANMGVTSNDAVFINSWEDAPKINKWKSVWHDMRFCSSSHRPTGCINWQQIINCAQQRINIFTELTASTNFLQKTRFLQSNPCKIYANLWAFLNICRSFRSLWTDVEDRRGDHPSVLVVINRLQLQP